MSSPARRWLKDTIRPSLIPTPYWRMLAAVTTVPPEITRSFAVILWLAIKYVCTIEEVDAVPAGGTTVLVTEGGSEMFNFRDTCELDSRIRGKRLLWKQCKWNEAGRGDGHAAFGRSKASMF